MATHMNEFVRGHAYGVVDAAMRALVPTGVRVAPLVPRRLARSAHLMPALVDLRSASEPELETLIAGNDAAAPEMRTPLVAVMLKATLGMDEVERHWNAMQLASPYGGGLVWLRMHDPRVLHQLFRILSPAQCRDLFGRVEAIAYRIGGEWVEREIKSRAQQPGLDRANEAPAHRDWARIGRIGIVNRALQRAGTRDAAQVDRCSEAAEEALDRAVSRYGLREIEDLTEFAFRALVCRAGFDDELSVAAAIRLHASSCHDSYLSDHFALINPDVWHALRSDK
ncbi:DUF4123 domain-containing protein [Massilia sp. CFBP9026]|uniref:DUF4123 domain-containing protein n=1 Tax=Massilia sp. CFBP9026 TaxID=3096536 RepID=UPI002A6B0A0E|nr:DUF4123 domain-containing protein [Massilia sp. CFBP9026]MDY0961185.1 DUF4123 domain-containing protein [Massilia sp. CFBP9026]